MQMYTIKIVAGAQGRVPTIVGFDLTRLRCESFIYNPSPCRVRMSIRVAAITIIPHALNLKNDCTLCSIKLLNVLVCSHRQNLHISCCNLIV